MSSEESEFVQKYGPVQVRFIDPPYNNGILVRPHALNYFHDGHLYRTRGERTSGRFELFFDLLYVGIVANLAKAATEEASGLSLLKYVLLFLPAWQIWNDMKDFMNYYYNNDLTQKLYVIWIMVLLVFYANNANDVVVSNKHTALVVVPYILARVSAGLLTVVYIFYVPEHRKQMIFFCISIGCTCCIWLSVIWISVRTKIAVAFVCVFLEITVYTITFHPWLKRMLRVTYSTAVNIEHEVDRMGAFYIIALGEFLYGIVANSPASGGFTHNFARASFTLIIAYCFCWFYFMGEGSSKAVHAIRRHVITAFGWLFLHMFVIASLILAADAAAELAASDNESTKKESTHQSEPEKAEGSEGAQTSGSSEEVESHYSLQFFLTGGLCIALLCLTILAFLDKCMDPPGQKKLSPIQRLGLRVPVAVVILCLAFAELNSTLLLGLIALLLCVTLGYETYGMAPKSCDSNRSEAQREENIKSIEENDANGDVREEMATAC